MDDLPDGDKMYTETRIMELKRAGYMAYYYGKSMAEIMTNSPDDNFRLDGWLTAMSCDALDKLGPYTGV